jgi:hypothetical protein
MLATILFPSGSVLYPLQTSPGGHLSLTVKPDVSLRLPPLLDLMPLWPTPFPLRPDEGDPLLNLLIYVAR